MVRVRGMPERDIESLGVMGWGLDAARKFFRRRRRRRRGPMGPMGPGPNGAAGPMGSIQWGAGPMGLWAQIS